jgi:hypothetical protein
MIFRPKTAMKVYFPGKFEFTSDIHSLRVIRFVLL